MFDQAVLMHLGSLYSGIVLARKRPDGSRQPGGKGQLLGAVLAGTV